MQKLDRSGSTTAYDHCPCYLFSIMSECSYICSLFFSITGSLGTSVINSTGLTSPVAPALGVSPAVSSLVPALLQGSVPTLPGQLVANLPVPTASIPTIDTIGVPSECVMLKNMFDPKNEVLEISLIFFSLFALLIWSCFNV